MARIHTHYDNLKVARNAPPEVIRAAYKSLSQKYHPDRNPDSTEAIRIIQIINSAYEVLSDPIKRREHDDWIARAEASIPEAMQSSHAGFSSVTIHGETLRRVWRRMGSRLGIHRSHRRSSSSRTKMVQKAIQSARRIMDQFSRYFVKKV